MSMLPADAHRRLETQPDHVFYTNNDADRPRAICDRNGEVVLRQCKKCGKAEIELDEPCEPRNGD